MSARTPPSRKQYLAGELEIEFNPQGTLAERIRAGGAGIPAFFTATGVGTQIAEGKETKVFDGRTYVMERGLRADLAVDPRLEGRSRGQPDLPEDRAELQSDHGHRRRDGRGRGRGAGRRPARSIPTTSSPPGIFVNRIVPLETVDKRIEQRTVRKRY